MNEMAALAGFYAAHAIWCVSDDQVLVPMFAYEGSDESPQMTRLEYERVEEAVAHGKDLLSKNPDRVARAVLLYDGYIHLPEGRTDAIIVEGRVYAPQPQSLTMAVPYRPASCVEGFAVHRPKFLGFEGPQPDWEEVGTAFFDGVGRHEQGATVWNEHLDESR